MNQLCTELKGGKAMASLAFDSAVLKLVFQAGMDDMGEAILRSKTFKNLRENLTAESLAQVVQALSSLSNEPLIESYIGKTEKIEL